MLFFGKFTNFFVEFTHFFVEFCRDRHLRAFSKILKILASSLFSFPCLGQILSNTPEGVPEPLRPSPLGLEGLEGSRRSRRRTCFHTSCIWNTISSRSAYIKLIDYIYRHSEVDQMNWQLTGKSVHCWVINKIWLGLYSNIWAKKWRFEPLV